MKSKIGLDHVTFQLLEAMGIMTCLKTSSLYGIIVKQLKIRNLRGRFGCDKLKNRDSNDHDVIGLMKSRR